MWLYNLQKSLNNCDLGTILINITDNWFNTDLVNTAVAVESALTEGEIFYVLCKAYST